MRKIALFLLMLPAYVSAQTIKVNLGPSFSTIVGPSGLYSTGAKNIAVGFSGNAGLDFSETKWGFLSGNLGVVQKGRKDKVTYTDENGNDSYTGTSIARLTYATANLTMNFKLSRGNWLPFISIGPRVDYLLSGSQNFFKAPPDFVIGANGGIGLSRIVGKYQFGARADYLYSFTKKPDDRTGTFLVFAGYKFSS